MALCQIIGPWDSQGLSPYSIIKSLIGVKSSLGANCQTTVSFTAQRLHASSLAAIYGSIMAALGLVQCQRGAQQLLAAPSALILSKSPTPRLRITLAQGFSSRNLERIRVSPMVVQAVPSTLL